LTGFIGKILLGYKGFYGVVNRVAILKNKKNIMRVYFQEDEESTDDEGAEE
jgi:hypothetical protein